MKERWFPEIVFIIALFSLVIGLIINKSEAFEYEFSDSAKSAWCQSEAGCKILAEVGYFEARGESDEGVYAVMLVVMNRVKSHKWGNTVKDVVHQPWQFSYRYQPVYKRGMRDSSQKVRMGSLAYDVYTGVVEDFTGGATHYHTTSIKPLWSLKMAPRGVYGNHVFYEGF